ncbi:MAG: S8 family serine peptidase [Odoribacter sp.]|nr:S8 family serine peptidase [Odoribacter sp.]
MKKISLFFLSALLLTSACQDNLSDEWKEASENESFIFPFSEEDVVKGRMRIKLKEEPQGVVEVRSADGKISTGISALDAPAKTYGITRMERIFPHAGKFEERSRREGLHLWYDIWFSEDMAATRAAEEVISLEEIEIATPVLKIVSASMPVEPILYYESSIFTRSENFPFNDTHLPLQWSYNNSGTESWQEARADIRLFDMWQEYNGHPDIIVAIVDGGIALDNPDLQVNLWINPGEVDGNGIDDDGNGYIDDVYGYNFVSNSPIITPHRHGTHVAGTIGGVNNNNIGVCGIARGDGTPNSGVKLMNCQIFEHPTNSYSDIVADNIGAAIKYGADNGAVISQNSWGYAADTRTETSYIDPTHKAAIDYFVKYAGCDNKGNQLPDSPMKGGIVLFAAGNTNSSVPRIAAPADYEKVLGVAAIGPDYRKASYSNYGDYIDISAPGGLSGTAQGIYSTSIAAFNYYEYRYGTSMSCPHVAGVAALVIEKHGVGKQGFTVYQLEEILLTSAYDLDVYNTEYVGKLGYGCVDASAALRAELPKSTQPFVLESNVIYENILSFRVNTELAGNALLTIYNSIGNKVFYKNMNVRRYAISSIDISGLAAGHYTLEYECNDNKVKEKFIKY